MTAGSVAVRDHGGNRCHACVFRHSVMCTSACWHPMSCTRCFADWCDTARQIEALWRRHGRSSPRACSPCVGGGSIKRFHPAAVTSYVAGRQSGSKHPVWCGFPFRSFVLPRQGIRSDTPYTAEACLTTVLRVSCAMTPNAAWHRLTLLTRFYPDPEPYATSCRDLWQQSCPSHCYLHHAMDWDAPRRNTFTPCYCSCRSICGVTSAGFSTQSPLVGCACFAARWRACMEV